MTGQHHFWIFGLDTSQIFIFDPYSGRAGPGPGAVPADIRRPADDSTPVVDTFMGGTMRVFDASDPHNPVPTGVGLRIRFPVTGDDL